MSRITRRKFARLALGAGVLTRYSMQRAAFAQPPLAPADFGLPTLGRIKPRTSLSIAASPLSIGFETLDRQMFDPERTYPHLAAVGVKWARCQTGWARTERAKGEYDFLWLDDVVNSLRKIGIQPWFNLGYGNRLYTPEAPHESAVGWAPLFTNEARDAWLRYVRKIAEHFADRVRHWEIWNEPNIANFWQPKKPSADDYVELVKMTALEIRTRAPDAVIIGGALAGLGSALAFLGRCMTLGMGDHVDRISYHPYRAVPESNYDKEVRALRDLLATHKAGIEIWQGENGCPSQKGGSGALADLDWNETRQAKWLLRRIVNDLRLRVELTSYFHTVDMVNYIWSSGQTGKTNYKGILRGNTYTRKPSYYAYQSLCAMFDTETRATPMPINFARSDEKAGNDDGKRPNLSAILAATFVRRDTPMVAYWYPADLQKDFPACNVDVSLGADRPFSNPVLADPLTGLVYGIERATREGGIYTFHSMPLRDYPLIITDAAVIGI
jgi:hypothetical protein